MSTDGVSNTSTGSTTKKLQAAPKGDVDAFSKVSVSDFLKLMITELQNQDPLNPMDNAQILNQIGQLQTISTSTKLNTTLSGMQLAQDVSSASALIKKGVIALDDDGKLVTGFVDSVTIVDSETKLHVGEATVSLANVKQIFGSASDLGVDTTSGSTTTDTTGSTGGADSTGTTGSTNTTSGATGS